MTPEERKSYQDLVAKAREQIEARKLAARQRLESQSIKVPSVVEAYEEDLKKQLMVKEPEVKDVPLAVHNAFQEKQASIIWNAEQQAAIDKGDSGASFCLIGKAGTGKTTCVREIVKRAITGGRIGPLQSSTKFLSAGVAGVAVVAFTNRAVNNLAKGMSKDLQRNCLTVHKLLEFEPVKYEYETADGEWKTSMRFEPQRNARNPLPSSLRCIIFEESSMISTELFQLLMDAIPHECQMIFLGDLQQLPPVYGTAILGYKLLELPVIELSNIYRQAADSPIISLAWKIASGEEIRPTWKENPDKKSKSKGDWEFPFNSENLFGRCWKKKLEADDALHVSNKLFQQFIDAGMYDPMEDMIMIPFNKAFGTDEFNKNIAQYLGKKRKAIVYEIIAGFNKFYYAVGDKVLVEKQEAIVEEIVINGKYASSQVPLPASEHLNRWGVYNMDEMQGHVSDPEKDMEDVENFLLATMSNAGKDEDEVRQQASHIMKCRVIGTDDVIDVSTQGEYSASSFSYALTVHKCQGSEWRKCFIVLHRSHAVMLSRELLYTAITRAREKLYIICEPESLAKGVASQRIKGNTIAEKAEYFKGKMEDKGMSLKLQFQGRK